MSSEMKKIVKDNFIKFVNEEQAVVFSKNYNPYSKQVLISMTGVCRIKEPEGFKNVPVMIFWDEESFKELIQDLDNIKI